MSLAVHPTTFRPTTALQLVDALALVFQQRREIRALGVRLR
jgi:hypothetical protein